MKVDDLLTTCLLVQAIDILSHDLTYVTTGLEFNQGMMSRTRYGIADYWPTDKAASPVALPHQQVFHKGFVLNGLFALPVTVFIPVIRDA